MKSSLARRRPFAALSAVSAVVLTLGSLVAAPTSASNGRSVTASAKDWSVTLWVARTSTKAGTTIAATVTVDNRMQHRVEITGSAGANYEILVGNAKVPNSPIIATVLCVSTMGPGIHVFHTKVQTTYQICGGRGSPPCGNPTTMTALPLGIYHTEVVLPSAVHRLPQPRPLTITLTA
jgi:hypothetical protein